MTGNNKCRSKSNSFVVAAEQVGYVLHLFVLEQRQRRTDNHNSASVNKQLSIANDITHQHPAAGSCAVCCCDIASFLTFNNKLHHCIAATSANVETV